MGLAAALRPRAETRRVHAATVDVGVSKTVCLIVARDSGEPGEADTLRALGIGVQNAPDADESQADFDACAQAIRRAVDQAERMAGEPVRTVTATYAGPGLAARTLRGAARLRGPIVTQRDVDAAVDAAIRQALHPKRALLSVAPLAFWVDDEPLAVLDAVGLPGRVVTAAVCVTAAPREAIDALGACLRAAGLGVDAILPGPLAAGFGALSPAERASGALVLDLGAGATGMAVFTPNGLAHAESIPGGGMRMTRDVAERLGSTLAAAERAKIVFGGVAGAEMARGAFEPSKPISDGRLDPAAALKSAVVSAMKARFEQVMSLARARLGELEAAGVARPPRAVLIGGGAQMPGAAEAACRVLGLPTRLGAPFALLGCDAEDPGSAYASAVGAALWRLQPEAPVEPARPPIGPKLASSLAAARRSTDRAWAWLRENF